MRFHTVTIAEPRADGPNGPGPSQMDFAWDDIEDARDTAHIVGGTLTSHARVDELVEGDVIVGAILGQDVRVRATSTSVRTGEVLVWCDTVAEALPPICDHLVTLHPAHVVEVQA